MVFTANITDTDKFVIHKSEKDLGLGVAPADVSEVWLSTSEAFSCKCCPTIFTFPCPLNYYPAAFGAFRDLVTQ